MSRDGVVPPACPNFLADCFPWHEDALTGARLDSSHREDGKPDIEVPMGRLSTPLIRSWRAGLIRAGKPGAPTIAKSYRLLHAACGSAVADGVIPRNPCAVAGASVERPKERPIATVDEVFALADAINPRYRGLLLLASLTLP